MQYRSGLGRELPPFFKIIVFVGIMLLCWAIAAQSLVAALPLFFGISDPVGFMGHIDAQGHPMAVLFILATNTIGMFLLPPLFFFLSYRISPVSFLRLDVCPAPKFWLTGIITMLAGGVFIEVLVQVMSLVHLPEQYAALRQDNKVVEQMIDAIFNHPGPGQLLLVSLVIAFLPALAEEIFFRGVIQNYLAKTNLGAIGAIIVSGLCFSMMHGEFDNFLAIWCMGIVLGLLYYYTGSLWINVMAHFANNLVIVVLKYCYHLQMIKSDAADNDILPMYVTLPAGLVMVAGLLLLRKWHVEKLQAS